MAPEHGRFNASPGTGHRTRLDARARWAVRARITRACLAVIALAVASLAANSALAIADDPPPASAGSNASAGASTDSTGATRAAETHTKPTESAAPATAAPAPVTSGTASAPALTHTTPSPGPDDGSDAPVSSVATPHAAHAASTSRTAPAAAPAGAKAGHGPAMGASDAASALPATSGAAPTTAFAAPTHFDDVGAWLEYRSHNHIGSLPQESRIFYRRGLQLHDTDNFDEAVRQVRGAAELDPEYIAPHLTLASWFMLRDPSQALLQVAAALELSRQSFVLQLALLDNALVTLIQALFLALLAAALMFVFMRNAQLRHIIQERLGSFVELRGARVWAWGILVLPYLAGIGLTLPALIMLGVMWPILRIRERLVFIALTLMVGAAPWLSGSVDRLSVPLRPEQGPLYGIPALPGEAYSPDRLQQMSELADHHPDDGFAQFALAWLARRGGDLQLSERAYRHALQIWPHDDRLLNNLGNTLAMQGRADEALAMYQRAYAEDPHNAAAYFNASQIFTQRFEYKAASDALSRASGLNFDLVKTYQAQATEDGLLPLVDQWLAARTFWDALPGVRAPAGTATVLPPAWRSHWECSGWPFSVLTVVLAIAALLIGRRLHAEMPLRGCSNCGCVVCRRCSERRRETALCSTCAAVELQAESAEFARVLLMQRRRGVARRWELLRTALATLIPGFGLLALDHLFTPLVLMTSTAALCGPLIGLVAPFTYEPRLLEGARDSAMWAGVFASLLVYALSLLGYLVARTRQKENVEPPETSSRPQKSDPPRRAPAAAA
jgi:Tfp pilus assembly protein PilF